MNDSRSNMRAKRRREYLICAAAAATLIGIMLIFYWPR